MSLFHGLAMESLVFAKGVDPVADAFDSSGAAVTSDVINMKGIDKVLFIIYKGVGTTGVSVVTVLACDDVVPTNTAAIAFRYRRCANATDAQGTITLAPTTGFATTLGSSEIYVVEVNKEDLAASGYGFVQLSTTETGGTNSPVVGCILTIGVSPRHAGATASTIIA